jgi:beta-glucuronidase
MPVPASYNDITEDMAVRDHVGVVWYDRTFYVPRTWNSASTKIWLRFGGVHYAADVVRLFASTCHYMFDSDASM